MPKRPTIAEYTEFLRSIEDLNELELRYVIARLLGYAHRDGKPTLESFYTAAANARFPDNPREYIQRYSEFFSDEPDEPSA